MATTASLEDVLLDGAREVFESMVFMPLERSAHPGPQTEDMVFLATITFTGDLEGCFGISSSHPGAQAIAAGMLGMESGASLSDSEIVDALGEIANMIMGGVKTRVQNEIPNIEISIPSVIHGRQLQNRSGESMARIAAPVVIGQEHQAELSLLYRQRHT